MVWPTANTMADSSFLYFSFIAGLAAFFAPCSFAMLPGYITYYISKNSGNGQSSTLLRNILNGIIFGLIASAGFFTVFLTAGFSVIFVGQFIKSFIPWIAVITGFALIIIGISMLTGKEFTYFQAPNIHIANKGSKLRIYLFGIVYAIGSLGCVFPIFLSIVVQSLSYNSIISSISILFVYVLAMSMVMVTVTALAFASKYAILQKIDKYLHYVKKGTAILLIIAGAYMIYYQYLLYQ